ncbi:MAG TPA: RNA methyltransferase [Acidobacteriaceae bacterium]|jgi:TrmH family RNA methyltransferase|nr:RNA methyltransferase [Acidobacteriaceae bacterium]
MPSATDRSRLISIVQSRQNARVRELRAAFARAPREVTEVIGLEGEHLLAEALRSGLRLRTVFVRADPARRGDSLHRLDRLALPPSVPIVELTPPVFDSAVETESPQGIAALVEPPRFSLAEALGEPDTPTLHSARPAPLVLIAAGLQDPGNFGALIRSAEAFAASGVLALPGTVDLWNAKALRASAGSAFRVPVVHERSAAVFSALSERRIPILAAVPAAAHDDAIPCSRYDFTQPAAILIGNEGSGLSHDLLDRADARIAIPMPGPVESLNAAIAASILLYEAARQRGASLREGSSR